MGGGSEQEWAEAEATEALAADLFVLCDSVAYGAALKEEQVVLESDYQHLDDLLLGLGDSLPLVVSKCAAHVSSVGRLRQLAKRYKELEIVTYGHLEGACQLGQGLLKVLLPLPSASSGSPQRGGSRPCSDVIAKGLHSPAAPSLLQSLLLAVERLHTLSVLLTATAAAHAAVSKDLDALVADAARIVEDPLKSDMGLQAAPLIGATAAGSLGIILLRGAIGPVGTIALGALGALGAQEYAQNSVGPQVKQAFQRIYDEAAQVSSLIDSKATALEVIAGRLMAASLILTQLLDLYRQPGNEQFVPAQEPTLLADQLHEALAALLPRCASCQTRVTAFMALTYKLEPKGQGMGLFGCLPMPLFLRRRQRGMGAVRNQRRPKSL